MIAGIEKQVIIVELILNSGIKKTATLIQRRDKKGKFVEVQGDIIEQEFYTGTLREIENIFLTPKVKEYNGQRKKIIRKTYETEEEYLKTSKI